MIEKVDIRKFLKPLLSLILLKSALFATLLALIAVTQQPGLLSQNPIISHCDPYINFKISHYQNRIQAVIFFMALIATLISVLQTGFFTAYFFKIKKTENFQQEPKIELSLTQLKCHFILIFIQTINLINIFLRSLEQLKQNQICQILVQNHSIVSVIISGINLCVLIPIYIILFRIKTQAIRKNLALREFKLFSDQMTLQQNLLFNRDGYIKQLLKIQNCQTPSKSLKNSVIKKFPSGLKKNKSFSNRQIVHKLKGGNKTAIDNDQIKINIVEDDVIIEEQNTKNQIRLQKKKNKEKQQVKMDYLQVHPKNYMQTPNDQNLKHIKTTLNVIKLCINPNQDKLENFKFDDQDSISGQAQHKTKKRKKNNELFDQQIDEDQDVQEQQMERRQIVIKKNSGTKKKINLEEVLQQRYNLTPNIQARKLYQNNRNYQNIDENGNYYFVDLDVIQYKTKFFQKLLKDQQQVLYQKNSFIPRQKRVAKKHEKNIKEYLNILSNIRKEEMLYQSPVESSDNENFESDSHSSDISKSSNQIEQEGVEKKDKQNAQQSGIKKEKKQPKQPQLYLFMKRRKSTSLEYKLKLFEKQQQNSYDQDDSRLEDQSQTFDKKVSQKVFQISKKSRLKKQSLDRSKHDQQNQQKNIQLDTYEGNMLRFIRNKYIEPHTLKNERSHILKKQKLQNVKRGESHSLKEEEHQNLKREELQTESQTLKMEEPQSLKREENHTLKKEEYHIIKKEESLTLKKQVSDSIKKEEPPSLKKDESETLKKEECQLLKQQKMGKKQKVSEEKQNQAKVKPLALKSVQQQSQRKATLQGKKLNEKKE